ncbi:MAG: hypothetical protein ACFFDP_08650 [Promethearchaeota archaeon]
MTIVVCPKCKFRFDTSYGRLTACGSCPSASLGDCGYAKCPHCQHEFQLSKAEEETQSFGRRVA